MDVEFDIQYKNLLVHHLERDEIEHELEVRGLVFLDTETRATLTRRLRERIKTDRERNVSDFDFTRLEITIDAEISEIDLKVKEIKDFLSKKKKFDGNRDALKTRLVHYFARAKRVLENAEEVEDLVDIDKLVSVIRSAFNTYFSFLSPLGQQDIINQLNQSFSNMSVAQQPQVNSNKSSSEDDNDFRTPGKHLKRSLRSVEDPPQNQIGAINPPNNNLWPFLFQTGVYPWMCGPPQMQMWGAQKLLQFSQSQSVVDPSIDLSGLASGLNKIPKPKPKHRSRRRESSVEPDGSTDHESDSSLEEVRK